jgi:hypothetical protein
MANIMIFILIGFMLLMIASIIFFGIVFTLRKRVIMKVLQPNKNFRNKRLSGTINREQYVDNELYFIDDACFIHSFWGDSIYYFKGNPNPIHFDFASNMQLGVGTKAQDLKSFHESDLIKKLFSTDDLDKIIMMLVIGVIFICIVILILQFTHKPVELSTTGNNTQMIADACRLGLRLGVTGQ